MLSAMNSIYISCSVIAFKLPSLQTQSYPLLVSFCRWSITGFREARKRMASNKSTADYCSIKNILPIKDYVKNNSKRNKQSSSEITSLK